MAKARVVETRSKETFFCMYMPWKIA